MRGKQIHYQSAGLCAKKAVTSCHTFPKVMGREKHAGRMENGVPCPFLSPLTL